MKANLIDIQKIYLDVPNIWVVDGIRIDNYSKCELHFEHGWREVVIPEFTEYQRLGTEYVLINDIVTKEVIDFTQEEIVAYNQDKAISIDLEYTRKIDDLMMKHYNKIQKHNYFGLTPYVVPQSAWDEEQALKDECNAKILALGITDFSYRQNVPKLAKTVTINK